MNRTWTEKQLEARAVDRIIVQFQTGIGQDENFEKLFKRYYRLVRHFFRRRGYSLDEAEDLTQESFLLVQRGLDAFRRDGRFESWLLNIAANVHRQVVRKADTEKRSRCEISLEAIGLERCVVGEGLTGAPAAALRQLVAKEQAQLVLEALEELPPQMRQCLRLRLTQGLRYREIAEELQLSVDGVKVQLARGRRRLRKRLAERFGLVV